jgi:hypothetical protein
MEEWSHLWCTVASAGITRKLQAPLLFAVSSGRADIVTQLLEGGFAIDAVSVCVTVACFVYLIASDMSAGC